MYRDCRILAVVPARGGSKTVKLKNLREVAGRPLVARAGDCLADVPEVDRAVVSTDHERIATVAEAAGLAAPFRRPADLSGDRVGDLDVLLHALAECERRDGVRYDVVAMVQPTSPLRRPEHVSRTITKLIDEAWDAVWTVSPSDPKHHPLKQLTVAGASGAMDYYDPRGARIIARQQLSPLYHRNGAAYAFTRACLTEQRTIKGTRTGTLIIDAPMISIDTEWDLRLVEFLLAGANAMRA